MRDLARRMAVPIVFAECVVSDGQAKARMAARALEPAAVSDATWDIYLQHKAAFAPFGTEFAACHLEVDGAADATEAACQIERFIAENC
jgi:predicted kinase